MAHGIAVIGAGYAGLAAAVELASAGVRVDVFEASRTLGGRARAVDLDGMTVDNGAHILVGAYRETLRLMRQVGVDPGRALRREPLRLEYPGELTLAAPRLPAPLHLGWALLAARGLGWRDKIAAVRFMRALAARNYRLERDMPAAQLFAAHGQGERLRRYVWEPLCVAALNTEVERASAQVFANVLRDSLGAGRAESDLLLPATDFSNLFPEPAARFVEAHGGRVLRGARLDSITPEGGAYRIGDIGRYEKVIVAVAPYHLPRLIEGVRELEPLVRQVGRFAWEPIVTAYLGYAERIGLPAPMIGVASGHAQWLFDRGRLNGQAGIIAAVISAHGRHERLDRDELAARIHEEVARVVPGLAPPRWTRIITEKRATFACTPDLPRPGTATALPGLYLAGDYVAGDYPATMEGAVRSGVSAARAVMGVPAARR